MKFAHLADLHLGSWREEKMRDLSTKAFLTAIDDCINRKVDFILFSGDLFNTSLPSLDTLKIVTKKLKELKDTGIPLYAIAGSHDFSPSGKTMLDVLENAGLLKNVCKGTVNPETKQLQLRFTEDKKTGAKITGLLGKKGLLDKIYYQNLSLENLEQEPGYKIFLFHTTISELKPKHLEQLESQPLSFLPKNFQYYAGGHIHHPTKLEQKEYGTFIYPGALFPNNFSELERYGKGGYALINLNDQTKEQSIDGFEKPIQNHLRELCISPNCATFGGYSKSSIEFVPVEVIKSYSIIFDCQHKTPEVVLFEVANQFNNIEVNNCLITIRLNGTLERGKVSDLNFKELFDHLYSRGAYFIMKNTSQLVSKEFEEIKITSSDSEQAEEEIIQEHLQQIKLYDRETEFHLTKSLLQALNTSKREGETVNDFQDRVKGDIQRLLNV